MWDLFELESRWLNTSRPLMAGDLEGRIVLVDFWTYCCINCIQTVPELIKLEKEFGDALTVIGVHSAKFENEKELENIRSAVLRYGIEHPVVNDADFRIWKAFGIQAWPTLILIGPTGQIINVYRGEGHTARIREDIRELISRPGTITVSDPLPVALEKNKARTGILNFPGKLIFAPDRFLIYVSDTNHNRVLGIRLSGEIVEEYGGFSGPQGLAYAAGCLYVADTLSHRIRRIHLSTGTIETLAGTGVQGFERRVQRSPALRTAMASPWDLAFPQKGGILYIAMAGTHQIWAYDFESQTVSVVAGNGSEAIDDGEFPRNTLSQPSGLSEFQDRLYFVDSESSSLRMMEERSVQTLLGSGLFDFGFKDGPRGDALLQHPVGVYADETGVYLADTYNHAIRHYDPKSRVVQTLAGSGARGDQDGKFSEASFNEPTGITKVWSTLYVADTNNHRIRALDLGRKTVRTLQISQSAESVIPNARAAPSVRVRSGKAIKISIEHPPGWKLSEDSPSRVRLLRGSETVWDWDGDELRGGQLHLAELSPGTYRIEAVFYCCEDKNSRLCQIQSWSQEVVATHDERQTRITLSLKGT